MKTELNLPPFEAKVRKGAGEKEEIFDPLRKRYVALTPEEWVRQHMIRFLLDRLAYPESLIAVEAQLNYNRLKKRADLVVYRRDGKPGLIVECKAPHIALTRDVLEQAAMYNMPLQVRFLVLTNGKQHHILHINREDQKFEFLDHFPHYDEL
jgi:type I site-specific restriction endonuclease